MSSADEWIRLLSTAGVAGAVAVIGSASINQFFAVRIANCGRAHAEKREAYVKLIEVYEALGRSQVLAKAASTPTAVEERVRLIGEAALALARVKLVGAPNVVDHAQELILAGTPGSSTAHRRSEIANAFINAARADLDVDRRRLTLSSLQEASQGAFVPTAHDDAG